MIARTSKQTVSRQKSRPLASPAGAKQTLGERLRAWFGLSDTPAAVDRMNRRRRILSIVLVLYLVLLIAGAAAYNAAIWREQAAVRTQVELGGVKVASMQRVTGQVESERQRNADLAGQLEQLYRNLPSAVELPIAVQRLSALPALSGGSVSGIEYVEPRWSGAVGQLQTHAALRGSLQEVVGFVYAMRAMLPSSSLERLSIRLDREPGRVAADMLVTASAIKDRPSGTPAWDYEDAWRRAEAAVGEVAISGAPFTPGAALWQQGSGAGVDLVDFRLAGIARRGGEAYALVVYDGQSVLVRQGSRVGAVEVVSIDAAGVVVDAGGRTLRLEIGGTQQGR